MSYLPPSGGAIDIVAATASDDSGSYSLPDARAVTPSATIPSGGAGGTVTWTVYCGIQATQAIASVTGNVGVAMNFTPVTAAFGSGSYTYAAPGLPAGLSINASTGAITGTPTSTFATGNITVTVSNSGDSATASKTFQLTVDPSTNANLSALAVSRGSLNPTFAAGTTAYTDSVAANITQMTVTPTVAESHATVTVNTVPVTSGSPSGNIALPIGDSTITVRVTAQSGATKDYVITVTRAIPAPTLTSLSASAANAAGDTTGGGSASTLTLTGQDFTNATSVTFGGHTFTTGQFTITNDTTITLVVPTASTAGVSGAGGNVNVTVSSTGGPSSAQTFTYVLTPTVSAVTTPTAINTPTISGTAAPNATINLSLTGPTTINTSAITANGSGAWSYVPTTLADGSYSVAVTQTVSTVTSGASSPVAFIVDTVPPSVPTISVPTENQDTATALTLSGGTDSGSTVEIQIDSGGFVAATVAGTTWSYNATGLSLGARTATVRAKEAAGNTSSNAVRHFNVVAAPTIGSLSQSSGPAAGGVTITLNGTNLTGATLTVDGSPSAVSGNTGTSFTFTPAAHVAGPVSVVVTTAGGTASTTYTYVAAPTIGAPSPASGPAAGGTPVTLSGSNLSGAILTVDGAGVAIGSNNGSVLTFTTPLHTAGAVPVVVTTVGGSASTSFTYIAAPSISSLSVTGGTTAGTTTVTLNGSNLTGATLTVGGTSVAVSGNTGSSFTFTPPAHAAGTVSVVVTTTGGSDTTNYTYIAPVTLSPASGALPGGTVNSAYSQSFTGGGGTGPYTYNLVGTLPTGVTFAGNTLSGTPSEGGTFTFSVTATDSSAPIAGTAFTATENYSVTVAKLSQSISFAAQPDRSLSLSPVTLSATASSGLTVAFTSTTTAVCTVSGTTLTLLTTGTCSVRADQAGSTAYDAAPPVTRGFTVTPANLVVTSGGVSGATVGASYSQANPASGGISPYTYTVGSGALPAGTTLDGSTGTVSGTPTTAGAFSYVIRATDSQGPAVNANGSTVSGNIAKGSQTISFTSTAPTGATVGGTAYTVTATATSALTVTFSLDGTSTGCALAGSTVTFTATGTCKINASQGGDTNWNAASAVQQSFAVNPAGAVGLSVSYSPSPIAVGTTGTLTITFSNPNSGATPAFSSALHSNNVVFTRIAGLGGSCGVSAGSTSIPSTAQVDFNNITIPAGTCTVTLPYQAASAGTATFSFDGFTPSGYPATATATSSAIDVLPSISSVSPASGPVSQVVTIAGTGFSTTPANNTVLFGTAGGTVTAASTTSLTVTAPATGSGAVAVTVTVNGQTSTNSQTFTFIDPPVAANKPGVAVPYDTATAIDLTASITGGPHSSIAIGTAPAHGSTSIAGDVVTYTPTAGYYGADSFTYTATGTGGTSNVATVGITVATPAAPVVADKNGVGVPYNGTGTAIDLSSSITGVHASIAIGTAPAHGTTSIAGDVVTYTTTAGYYGADSFTYTATGPGGTSAPATVTLSVATPAAPVAADKNGVAVPYASTGTAIDLSGSITGVHVSIAIGTAPAHGSTSIAGDVVTYTPAAGYYGADSFTYTVTGPGGTSAPATVTLSVATPAAPVAGDKNGVAVAYASTGTAIDLSGSITGVHGSIAIGTAPAHGTTSIAGDVVTYTPTAGYYGADSFTYTATGPGGTSAPATIGLSVTPPAAPVAADKNGVAVPYASTGAAIDLSASITGVHASIAIGTAPAHGTTSIAGDVVTYTPAAGYYGTDSFTYAATGPGGTSAPATVSLTVAPPPAPVAADKSGVAVPYASSGTPIDLSGSITGVRASIAVATAPAHGTVVVAGEVATYTPAAGYYGADSFTYTATGPGGTSAPATVSMTVATPAAPTAADKSGVTVGYNSAGTAIDLSSSVSGVHSALTVSTAPTHGTVAVNGDVVTYVPTNGYFGADSFAYTATGPGGTSAAATVGLSVSAPPPPVAEPGTSTVAGSTTTVGTSVSINLSTLVTGVYDTIQIATPPAHGAVTLSGGGTAIANPVTIALMAPTPYIATYTPTPNFVGTDSFTFVAVGPGGTSAPGTVTITVVGQVPIAAPKTASTGDGQMVSVMLTDGAARGPFTSANVVSVSPAGSATTAIVASGSGASAAYRLDVTPNNRFGGTIVVTYTLSNLYGVSAPSTVTLTVQARPDPREDPNIGAISDAQAEAARRFGRAQVSNFLRRTEQLHNGGGRTGMAMGLTLNSRDGSAPMQRPTDKDWGLGITERMRVSGEDPALGRYANDPQSPLSRADGPGYARTVAPTGADAAPKGAREASGDMEDDGTRRIGSVASWAGGAIDIGTRDRTTDRTKVTATTAGLSAGADIKLADGVLVGLGGGYGNDLSRIGTAAQVRGTSTLYAAYASIQPAPNAFIDSVVGRGQLDFTTRRIAAAVDATARGSRDGSYTVAAISLGVDRGSGPLQWSIYGRGEYLDADLDPYVESGAGRYDLRFDAREVRSITGTIGGRIQYRQKVDFGSITPRLRAEWNHEFADVDPQWLDYADIPGAAVYALAGNGWKREQLQLSLGTRFDILSSGWSFDMETGLRAGQGEKAGTLQLRLSKKF